MYFFLAKHYLFLNIIAGMNLGPPTVVDEYTIHLPGLKDITHIAIQTSQSLWIGNWGTIQKVNRAGHFVEELPERFQLMSTGGTHTVCKNGDLLFIEKQYVGVKIESKVHRMMSANYTLVLNTSETCQCIHSSLINNDILLGVISTSNGVFKAKVERYNSSGHKIQEIMTDGNEQTLYKDPRYITENPKNRDIVVSDEKKMAVVVVDQYGRHLFDYRGRSPQSSFFPKGVCTDIDGNILLTSVNEFDSALWDLSLLDKKGHLTAIFRSEPLYDVLDCISLCLDNEHKQLFVGYHDKIMVFRYNRNSS